jgi:hypothetical protein
MSDAAEQVVLNIVHLRRCCKRAERVAGAYRGSVDLEIWPQLRVPEILAAPFPKTLAA